MKNIKKQEITDKYKNTARVLYPLRDGDGEVIGEEADENNQMVYAIKRKNGIIEVVPAKDVVIVPIIHQAEGFKRTRLLFHLPKTEEKLQGNPQDSGK
jgi:hypothetical protein